MPAFKKFGPGDQVDNVLVLEPQYNLVSGSINGWRGSPEGSASLSLYGGLRRSPADVIPDIRYQRLYPAPGKVGQAVLGTPLTASVNYIYMTDDTENFTLRTSTRWDKNHWDTVMRLYQLNFARDPDFMTASYDHYCLYFQRDSNNIVVFDPPSAAGINLTGSFTVEAWVKPFQTSSLSNDFTIASMNQVFWFGITGSTGLLQLSSSYGTFTASIGPQLNRWSHVSLAYDVVAGQGAFTVNMADAGVFTQGTMSASLGAYKPAFTVGNQLSGTGPIGNEGVLSASVGQPHRAFQGFIGETRLWSYRRTISQLSASRGSPIEFIGQPLTGSVVRSRLGDGPLLAYPTDVNAFGPTRGSGTLDWAAYEQDIFNKSGARKLWGSLNAFNDRAAPTWHPNDNIQYVVPKRQPQAVTDIRLVAALGLTTGLTGSRVHDVHRMQIIDVPSAFYGRQIVPNSVNVTCRSFDSGSYGLVRTLIDDGRGGLFISGSACSSTLVNREDYRGVEWNKVGNVFYGEGLIVIKDQSIMDFGTSQVAPSSHLDDLLQVSFRGQSRVPVKTLMCHIDRGEFNCSSNVTFSNIDNDGHLIRSQPSGSLRVSTVGIYNSDRELVGVARLADPVRIRARDKMCIKVRIDF